ncbi:hypothetical protein ASG84_12735 [Rhodococcus sp. Leaf278]|uniref:hypothetical protein n=1 Tax=Rhodococcus sp. Leaf278 TaxID=1736319 RepID=UPI00070EAF05|nr:hypothetical protein [Rhodococcus sp. Leaf278]KQU44184.1 hypothetical protein ASG84_12735 [Rhodococcus sp. Leaf278]
MTLHVDLNINSDSIGSLHVTRILNGPDGFHDYRVEYRDNNNHFYVELAHQESRGALELTRRAIEAVQAEKARQAKWMIDQMKAFSPSRDIIADLKI